MAANIRLFYFLLLVMVWSIPLYSMNDPKYLGPAVAKYRGKTCEQMLSAKVKKVKLEHIRLSKETQQALLSAADSLGYVSITGIYDLLEVVISVQPDLKKQLDDIRAIERKYMEQITEIGRELRLALMETGGVKVPSEEYAATEENLTGFSGRLSNEIRDLGIQDINSFTSLTLEDLRVLRLTTSQIIRLEEALREHGLYLSGRKMQTKRVTEDTRLEELGIPTQLRNLLSSELEVETLGDLLEYSYSDLLKLEGVGPGMLLLLHNSLTEVGRPMQWRQHYPAAGRKETMRVRSPGRKYSEFFD